jgi:hypothetical protein
MKITGAEWKKFYADPEFWGRGQWHDEEEITIDGEIKEDPDYAAVPDAAVLKILSGIVFDSDVLGKEKEICSLKSYLAKWRKKQHTVILVVSVPKEKEKAARAGIVLCDGKILGGGGAT